MSFDPNRSVFAGMSQETLQAALANAQTALIALQTGTQAIEITIGAGPAGTRTLRYRQPQVFELTQLIRELQAVLGIVRHDRRAIGVRF